MIVDARSTNALFKDPRGVELCSSEEFSRIECEVSPGPRPGSPEILAELQPMNVHIGLSDVKGLFPPTSSASVVGGIFLLPRSLGGAHAGWSSARSQRCDIPCPRKFMHGL